MKTIPLAHLLLEMTGEEHYKVADCVQATPSMLSRVCNGLARTRSDILKRLAAYLTPRIGVAVDESLLSTHVDARTLIAVVHHIRSQKLQKGIPA
jgi:hypothetical protein